MLSSIIAFDWPTHAPGWSAHDLSGYIAALNEEIQRGCSVPADLLEEPPSPDVIVGPDVIVSRE